MPWNKGQRALCSCTEPPRAGVVISGSRRAPTVQIGDEDPHVCTTAARTGGGGRPGSSVTEVIRLGGRALEIAQAGAERDQVSLREWVETALGKQGDAT